MADGQLVTIRKALEQEYNGVYAITNVTTNAYDYTVSGTPATPATGTIKATAAIVSELTSAGGVADNVAFNYSADQPISGVASKSSAAPFYKAGRFTGTIGTGGFSTTLVLVLDE